MGSKIDQHEWPIEVFSSCQICGGNVLVPLYAVDQENFSYLMMLCRKCRHIQVGRTQFPPHTKKEQADYFAELENKGDINWHGIDQYWGYTRYPAFDSILNHLNQLGINRGKLIDIGSAFGHFADMANKKGFVSLGIEPSAIARRAAYERFGVESFDNIDNIPADILPCDVVVCTETLYYLTDIRQMLWKLRGLLRPGGILVLKLKGNRTTLFQLASIWASLHKRLLRLRSGSQLYGWALRGYHLFTTTTVCRLLNSSGFEILKITNEKEPSQKKFSWWIVAKHVRSGCTVIVNALTFGRRKIGTTITIYATPVPIE
jgi:SAM-dependent methyltransferase